MLHCETSSENSDLKLSIFDSIHLIPQEHWDLLLQDSNVYLSVPYLKALEESLKEEIGFRYIIFYNHNYQPAGIAVVQLLHFTNNDVNVEDVICRFGSYISDKFVKNLDVRVLLCGNAFSTGENGFLFCKTVNQDVAIRNLSRALNRVKRDEKKANNGVSIILLKDFWPSSESISSDLIDEEFSQFQIDVNMVMEIPEEWKSFEDYLESLVTKFRTKVKGIYKKSQTLESRKLSSAEILEYAEDIDTLYHNVLERSDYKFGELNANTFALLADSLDANFRLTGYFIGKELVGFCSCFKNQDSLDANFVGLDYSFNKEYAIYQRILCDFIDLAIQNGVKQLSFGRTAEEIKSTLGAGPVDMTLYVKHKNSITNKLVKPIVSHITPSTFELRKPFKAVFYQG